MRKPTVILVLVVVWWALRPSVDAVAVQQSAIDSAAIDSVVRQGLSERGIPGAAVAIVSKDAVVYERGFGVANVETGAPITPDMLFRISSNTKVFTATALLMLAAEGKLRLDEPIGGRLPGLSPALSRVSAHQLMTHTAGLSDDLSTPGLHDASALLASARSWKDDYVFMTPGTLWSYSSPGFALAGAIVEEVGRRPYAEQIADRLFRPLGMTRTTFHPTVAMTFPFAQGHHPSSSSVPTVVRPYPDNAARWPTGYVMSNVVDLARFVRAFMNGGTLAGKQVIPAAIVAQLGRPYTDVPNRSDEGKYGYGMYLSKDRGLHVVWHGGDSSGFGSLIRMLPDKQLAVIALWNLTGGSASFVQVSDRIMDLMLGREVASAPTGASAQRSSLTETDLLAMAGTYSNPHLGDVSLSVRNQKLFFTAKAFDSRFYYLTGGDLPLDPTGQDRFSMTPPGLRRPVFVQILRGAGERPEFVHFSSRAFKKVR